MSITMDLSQELESRLVAESAQLGLSVTEYALSLLSTGDRKRAIPKTMELIQDAKNAAQVHQALKLVAPLAVVWPTETDCNRALSHPRQNRGVDIFKINLYNVKNSWRQNKWT